jgi:hypothetical protein
VPTARGKGELRLRLLESSKLRERTALDHSAYAGSAGNRASRRWQPVDTRQSLDEQGIRTPSASNAKRKAGRPSDANGHYFEPSATRNFLVGISAYATL